MTVRHPKRRGNETYVGAHDQAQSTTISKPPAAGDTPTCSYVLYNTDGGWLGDLSYYGDSTLNLGNWVVDGDVSIWGTYSYSDPTWFADNIIYYDASARQVRLGLDYIFDATVNVGVSEDDYILKYDHSTGLIGLEAETAGSGVATVNTQDGNYTLVAGDANNIVQKASGGAGETYTIPANASVAYAIGTLIAITNDGGGDLTIAITTDVLEGTDGATGSRTLSDNNSATLEKMTATKWRYSSTDIGGGGTPEYASFYCTTPGNTNVTTTEQQATLDSTLLTSDAAIFALSSSTVTVNKTAHFKITYDLTIQQDSDSGDARTHIEMWVDVDSVEIGGSRTAFYTRGYSKKSSGAVTFIVAIIGLKGTKRGA